MRKVLVILVLFSLNLTVINAQFPGMRGGGGNNQNMNIGHFYGKIVDSKNKGVEGASILLIGNKFDTVTKKMKEATLKTVITQSNGDFSIQGLSLFGNFKLKISAVGFTSVEKPVNFGIKFPTGGGQPDFAKMAGMADKDLGNLKLEPNANDLGNVTVTSSAKQFFEMGVDRKIFNVDKNLNSTGQTATEIMRNIPSLNVDIDGNVTLRNAAPQLFIDGRPTTLTLEQIPADIVDKVELITNPSAKFDASGGNAGILNIVLKKNKKTGYNGGLRYGIDSRLRSNLGGDINLRANKINFFASGNFNQRKSLSWSNTYRDNFTTPVANIYQFDDAINNGFFAFARTGLDYFVDNRNTISVAANFVNGSFLNDGNQFVDSTIGGSLTTKSKRTTATDANFKNLGGTLSFKHNFAKNGHEWTADLNYNRSKNNNAGFFATDFFAATGAPKFRPLLQQTIGNGSNEFITIQTDYENPITDNSKIELGARAAIRNFQSNNQQLFYDYNSGRYITLPSISANYKYTDNVYAAYATYSFKKGKWSYQLGLRVESSNYNGSLLATKDSSFKINFPLSLFPSTFITYKKSDKEDIQINFSRRVNRPNFFQLIPFIDYTDPQNLSVGNATLKPEFTNSFELSYNNAYKKGANFLASAFFKYSTNLITNYQYKGTDPLKPFDSVVFNTFANANNSIIYGLELTNRMPITKTWDMTVNVNLFSSQINANNVQQNLDNQLVSWFAKINNSFKLKKGYSIQLSADYQAKTVLPQTGGGARGGGGRGGFGGGMMFGGGNTGTAQGFILPRYAVDLSIRKDFTWKGGNTGSVTVSMNDIFRTQLQQQTAESLFFTQRFDRRRDPQVLRVNFSWRFGKFDPNLFKRKSMKGEMDGGASNVVGG